MSSTHNLFRDVADFHELILKDPADSAPTLISLEFCMVRAAFMAEELTEYNEAIVKADIVGIADALADIIYVALGTAYKMGLPFNEIWNAVHSANMHKIRGTTKRKNKIDAMKPVGWRGPEAAIARAIMRRAEDASA